MIEILTKFKKHGGIFNIKLIFFKNGVILNAIGKFDRQFKFWCKFQIQSTPLQSPIVSSAVIGGSSSLNPLGLVSSQSAQAAAALGN